VATIDIGRVRDSHARLALTLSRTVEADARRPSMLPGWTVGHVLTHLARNADSHVRMLEAAARGEVGDQYPGGNARRAADIEAGAGRSVAELVDDVLTSAARWEAACEGVPDEVWRTGQGRVVSGLWALADLPFRRWREVEVHHVDLGLDYGPADWPDGYVDLELARTLEGLADRLPPGTGLEITATDTGGRWAIAPGPVERRSVAADRRTLLAWLLGRAAGDAGFPPIGPWTG
jgi:maleylpyruvate isomerase